jgi:hypothetical protein
MNVSIYREIGLLLIFCFFFASDTTRAGPAGLDALSNSMPAITRRMWIAALFGRLESWPATPER